MDLIRAFAYRDLKRLSRRPRTLVMDLICLAALIALLAFAPASTGSQLFGLDFVVCCILGGAAFGVFLEHYALGLSADAQLGLPERLALRGVSPVAYSLARAILPLVISLAVLSLGLGAGAFTASIGQLGAGSLPLLALFALSELALAVGCGLLLIAAAPARWGANPATLGMPLMLANGALIYLANPLSHPLVFLLLSLALATLALATGSALIKRRIGRPFER